MRKMNFLLNWSKKDQVKREQAESGYGLPVIGYGKQKAWMKVKLVKLVNFAMQIFNSVWCKVYGVESRKTEGEQPRSHQLISNLSLTVGSCCPRVASVLHSLRSRFDSVSILSRQSDLDQVRAVSVGLSARVWKHVAMIFAVLVMSMANIGMAWGASVSEGTYNFVDQTIGGTTKFYKISNGIYQYRLNAYSRNTSLGIQMPASGDGTGFVFHLESTQKVYIGIIKKNVKREVTNNLYIKTITEANFSAIEAGSNNSTTVTLTLGGSATLSGDYTFAAIGTAKTEGATVYMGELPAGYYYAYGNSSNGEGNLYSITFGTQTLFLVPNDKTSDNAKFAIYYWMGASGYERQGWSDYMTVSPCNSSTYRADIPKGYTKVIFVRLNPSGGRNWDSKWNKTGDLTFDGSKDLFTWANGSWDGVTTTWSASTKYTISFAANGGTNSMSNVSNIACGRSVTLAANAYEKSGYTFAGWKTNVAVTANGSPVAADGIVDDEATISNITSNITLTAQWEEDVPVCSAPTSPSISGTTAYTVGDNISLTASASGTSGSTTYTWYKGADWATASATSPVQATSTSGATFTKNSCVAGDAGTYWCNISNGTGCDVQASKTITVSAACAASAPGNISKGEASGGTGTITLTSAGSPVSGDTWYWQASASGTSKSESGATKNVNAAGTYYIRSYNTSGDCWSDAKSVTVAAADLLTPISLSLSYDNPKLVLTALTTATPTLTGNAGSGSVSYVSGTPATATVNGSTGVVSAVAAGTTTITVNVAANGNYAAGSTTATIKVVAAPLGIVDQKLATGAVTWDASDIVTSDYTNITGLSAFAAQGGLSIDGGNGTTSSGTALTAKVEASGGTSKADAKYMEFHFTVAAGKRLHVTAINAVVRSVSNDRVYYATLTGTTGSITKTTTVTEATSAGANIFAGQSYDEYFTGTVSFKLWAYSTSNQTKNLWYRMGSNIYITGTIEDICDAPSALTAASPTAKGATLTVTDANDVNNYEFYVSTESTAPEAGATATHSVSSNKSLTITNLVAGTTYYAWARSVCGVSNKSGWTALTGNTFTTSTVTVTHTLTNVTKTSGATTAGGSDYTAVYSANTDYSMPTPVVTIDGNTATSGTDYIWTAGTGTITIPANKINGNIVITLNSVPSAPSSAVISGTYHYFPGENISLTCTPSGNNGPTTYQWYKGGKENGNAIEGATSATFTKNSCAFDDAGSYYCKVTCNATSIWANTNSSENYDVKILRLYVNGSKGGDPYGNVDFVKVNSTTATASIALGSNWTYGFNIADGCGHYYGNSGTMQYNSYGPWVTNQNGVDCGLTTTNAATYVFTINYSNLEMIETTVTFPSGNQTSGKVIYFDNNDLQWENVYYRIGKSNHVQSAAMTKVYGTANLYQYTTPTYDNFAGWHITNAAGATGSYSVYNTKNGTAITEATAFEGAAVTQAAVTVTPTSSHATGETSDNNNCEFYTYGITTGMKTQNVEISPYTNGTITVNYTNTSNVASTLTSGNADLAHSVILTSITAVPNTGYDASAITINGGAYSANYVVTGATTIAASFTPQTYSITYKDQGNVAFSGTHVDTPNAHPTTHTYNTATTLNSATKTGYTFGGWFGNPECTGVALSSIGATSISADITLYAKWTVNNYDLTWDTNGGSDLVCTGSCTEGTTAYGTTIVAPSDPTLSNYTFDGWKTNNDGTGTAAAATMPAADATYYAAWKQTVTLKTGSQGSGADKTPYVYLNGAGVSSFTAHSADGYTLQGYYSASSGGVKVLNADGTFAGSNVTDYITSSKWSRTGATTLYAQWLASVDCSTSDFVIKKGSSTEYQGCMESTSYDGTATSFTAGSPTTVGNAKMTISNYDGGIKRPGSGNVFSIVIEPVSGYYLKSVCWAGKVEDDETVSYYWDNNSGSATTITPQTTSGTGVTYNAPNSTTTKFTASYTDDGDKSGGIWWRNVQVEVCAAGGATYNVTYDDNGKTGGSVPTDATAYSYGGTVTVKDNTGSLAKTNYTFAGWATNDDGTGSNYVADNTFSITDNTTLYAKWTQAVTLDANTANHGSTGGSATAVWNATGLTGITHATPASGYKLTGYYTAATSGTKVLNSDGTYASTAVTDYITSSKWSRTGEAPTLYAQYEAAGALTWNLVVNSDTTALATASKTSAFTEISTSNMTDAAVNGVTYSKGKKSSLTGKISTPSSYDASKYVYVTFQVASGYKFTPSSIKVKAQPVTTGKDVKLSLTDESSHSLVSASATSVSGGSTQTVTLAGDGTFFTGTVTLKIYCYGATDAYRLGTPITIEGAVEATCTMPSYTKMSYTTTEYIKDAEASAISVLGGENVTTYQWKYNTTSDRTSGTNCGTNSASYTPSTGSTGTLYYWCELTNACGTIKTPAVGITVSADLTDPTVVWTDPAGTVNYGGGGYTIRATVQETGWSGTLAASMLTAPAGIRIYDVTTGTDGSSKKYIEATFDVQTTFDRTEYTSAIPFTLSLPETNYAAKDFDHDVAYTSCSGSGAGTSYNIRVRKSYTKVDNKYYWDNTDGWISSPNPSSSISSSKASTTMATVFDSVSSSNADLVYIRTYHANIKKVRIYADFRANNMTVSNVYKNSDFFSANSKYEVDYSVVYNGDEENADLGTAAQGYVDITLSTVMAANDILLVKFNTSRVRPLGAVITEGSAGSLTTALTFATAGPIAKTQSSANFTNAATVTTYSETLGTISYSSSNTDCATVNATTGEVTITASGAADLSTTITAKLAASGCYKSATASYVINVAGVSCTIAAGTLTSDVTSKCSTDDATLTLTDFEAGATIQWYNGESPIDNGSTYAITTAGTTSTMVTKEAGTYSVMVTKDACSDRSNSITITNISAEASATKIVDSWYVKNGRLTPDIALWTLGEGTTLKSVAWSPSNATGLSLYEGEDGIVYLEGKEPSANTSGADIVYTLTLTVTDACGTNHALSTETITITHQKNTDKHVLAFVVTGTEKGGWTAGIPSTQTTGVDLYNTIAANFDVLATNIYSTDDEQKLKEYYSQFDILCITDYPNTGTKGVNKKSYVDAIGALIDIRPILTMEAFVSKLTNWKAKGISGTPESPSTRQYSMLLQCKDHEIFSGCELTKVGEGEETMYRINMVDNTKESYATLDASYSPGSKDYDAGGKPALQGFTFTSEMADADLLPLGLIDDGAGNDLQVGIERQHEMSARLMVLGINGYAMERLATDGQTVVVNALKYLMKKSAEDIADCSNNFVGGVEGHEDEWEQTGNWSGNTLPDKTQNVRILAPCVISDGTIAHVAGVKIIPSGKINHGADDAAGQLTIAAGGALKVEGKVEAATAPAYNRTRPTAAGDLIIGANSSAQGCLIFDNEEGETNATVAMYSASYWEVVDGKKKKYWSYVAIPIQSGTVGEYFYNGFSYLYDETSGWIKKGMYTELHAFEGLGISMQTGNMEYFHGALAPTTTQEITLTKTPAAGDGENLIGNSWTAPIQIANFDVSDFGDATATVMIYSTGRDDVKDNPTYVTATVENDGAVSAGQWLAIPIGLPGTTGYDGLSVIPAMQAFQVNTASETTLILDYDKLVRDVNLATDNLTEKQHSPVRRAVKKDLASVMRVRVSGTRTRADVWLLEDNRFSDEFDNGWEAAYIDCDERSPQLYAQSPIGKMAFLAQPDMEGTVLGIAPSRDGNEYLFTFHYVGSEEYYLNDIKLQKATLINDENSYEFTFDEGDTNRFYISRTPLGKPAITTGVENTNVTPKAQKFIYQDKLYILRNGVLYDATGKVVK